MADSGHLAAQPAGSNPPAAGAGPAAERQAAAVPAIFWAGLCCGVLDITAAFVTWGLKGVTMARRNPRRISP